MFRRLVGRILRPNACLASIGIAISLFSGWQIISLLRNHERWTALGEIRTAEFAGLLGLVLIAIVVARSLLIDVWNGFVEKKRIVSGSGQAGTAYDYRAMLSRDPKEVIVVAQNMRTLLSDDEYLPCISDWLGRNKDRHPSLTFVLSTPEVLSQIGRDHLKQSVAQLKTFLSKEPMKERIHIRFHSGVGSLSAFVCDPKDKSRGVLVFTPKWALDAQPANRMYCVVERWEHDDLFNLLAGSIPAMVQIDSRSLDEVCQILGVGS